jgi:hypothetical protein
MGIIGADYLPGCSKLQDLLEIIINELNKHEEDHKQAVARLDILDPDGAATNDGDRKVFKLQDVGARVERLEAIVLEQDAKHKELVSKVGVDPGSEADQTDHMKLLKLAQKMDELEEQVHHVEEQVHHVEEQVQHVEEEMHEVEAQVEKVEKREDFLEEKEARVEAPV